MEHIIFLVGLVVGYVWMKHVKSILPQGQVIQDPLNKEEKLYIWLLSFACPMATNVILYYGWRKVLPQKARSANLISWIAVTILIIVSYTPFFFLGVNPLGLPTPTF
jgi:predicted membrane channel-forming protein YqfA (hemolysin III family)